MKNNDPIGIFDSGIGGLSILTEITKLLPKESVIYLADKANFPYGNKTPSQIKIIAKANAKRLLAQNVKLIVVACNTATVGAIEYLREQFPRVSFVGTEPAVKPAAMLSKKGIIILSSPQATKSLQLKKLINKYAKNIKIFNIGSLELVKAVEEKWEYPKIKTLLTGVLPQNILNQSDVIVLGCTHFPLIRDYIKKYAGNNIKIIDSSIAVARQVKKILWKSMIQ